MPNPDMTAIDRAEGRETYRGHPRAVSEEGAAKLRERHEKAAALRVTAATEELPAEGHDAVAAEIGDVTRALDRLEGEVNAPPPIVADLKAEDWPASEPGKVVVLTENQEAEVIRRLLNQYGTYDTELRMKIASGKFVMPRRSRIESLDDAVSILMKELEPPIQDAINQISDEQGFPIWVIFLGAVSRAADLRELHAGDYHPNWLNGVASGTGAGVSNAQIVCQLCGNVIPNARRGQVACCNRHGSGLAAHSDECAIRTLAIVRGFAGSITIVG
jgi:hypothetical protein